MGDRRTYAGPQVDTYTTKNALRVAAETEQIATNTMVELEKQQEILDRVEDSADNIHGNLDMASRLMKGMESWTGAISNWFTSAPQRAPAPPPRRSQPLNNSPSSSSSSPSPSSPASSNDNINQNRLPNASGKNPSVGGLKVSASNILSQGASTELRAQIEEQEADLDEINKIMGNLNQMATSMGTILNDNIDQIDRINDRVEHANHRINSSNRRIDRIS